LFLLYFDKAAAVTRRSCVERWNAVELNLSCWFQPIGVLKDFLYGTVEDT
jgi:hypothetical protein